MSSAQSEGDAFTDVTDETESNTTTDTTVTFSIGTCETSEGATIASTSESHVEEEGSPAIYPLPQDLLSLEGRHIKAEDFEWGTSPVLPLADILVEAASEIEGSDLEKFLKNANDEQRQKIMEILPLDLPLRDTISMIGDGIYWKRQCLKSWPAWDVWRYSDSWKSMFVHRSVQELIEEFVPDNDNILDLRNNIEIYSKYVNSLQIRKLIKATPKSIEIDVHSENLDQELDDILSVPTKPIYLDFEKIFDAIPHLKNLTIAVSPSYINLEDFHFNNADFNCLFRAMQKLDKLENLRISNGNFSNTQLTEFLKMFQKHKALKVLNLSFNFIDDSTCMYVAALLISPCPVECLILMDNKITDAGAMTMASVLFVDSSLQKLDLSLNMIGDKGGDAIARVLLKNNTLIDLDLSKNKITEKGGLAFAEIVKKTRSLRNFKIQENFLGEKAGKEFLSAIKENDYLLKLDVRFCGFSDEDEGLIHQILLQNRSKVPYSNYVKNNKTITTASEFLF